VLPRDLGLAFSTWSLAKLAEYLVATGIAAISRESIRQVLHDVVARHCHSRPWPCMVYLCSDGPLGGAVVTRWQRWLARRPTGRTRVGAWAVLAVTGVALVVLAALSHQAWSQVVVAVLISVPGVYLAWPAEKSSAPETTAAEILARGQPAARWDLRRLGVHAAISVPGAADDVPPGYVQRDVDDDEFGVRAQVAAAARRGGFVLLAGGSSVGKTRSAAEAVTTLLPKWWLVHPGTPGEVAALAAEPSRRLVVWLDELQLTWTGRRG
jgi:hypothetical protein